MFLSIFGDFQKQFGNIELHTDQWKIKKFADKLKDIVCLLIGCTRKQLEDENFKNTELGEEWWYYKTPSSLISYLDKNQPDFIKKYLLIKLTPRKFLQLIGIEYGRNIIHSNIWVNSLMSGYKAKDSENSVSMLSAIDYSNCIFPNWIITDMRFPNELQAVKDKSGITIRIERDFRYFLCDNCMADNISINEMAYAPIDTCPRCKKTSESNLTMVIPAASTHESEISLDKAKFDYTIKNKGSIEDLILKVKEILIKEKII